MLVPPPARYHTSQPVAQPANITVSPHPGFSRGAGRAGRGRTGRRRGGRQHRLKNKKMVTQSNRTYLHFRICLDFLSCPLTHTHARRGTRLQLLTEEGQRADLQPEFAAKWKWTKSERWRRATPLTGLSGNANSPSCRQIFTSSDALALAERASLPCRCGRRH